MSLPRICFVAPNLYPVFAKLAGSTLVGGAEVQQSFLVRELRRRGYSVSVLSSDFGQGAKCEVEGVRFIRMFENSAGFPVIRAFHPRMSGLWRALKLADADVYYNRCATMSLALVVRFCQKFGRTNIFAGASDLDFVPGQELIQAAWYRAMFRYGLRRTPHVVVQNPTQLALFEENYGGAARLIPSVFLPPSQTLAAGERREILWCGVLRPGKRVEILLELARRLPQYFFRVVGGADSSEYSKRILAVLAQESSRLPNLSYDGFLPYELADGKFLQAKLFLNTSDREGFPNTFLQAWARGVPTLSFVDVGARMDGHDVGVVCTDEAAMEAAILRLMEEPEAYAAVAERARNYFLVNHTVESCVDKYESIWQRSGVVAD